MTPTTLTSGTSPRLRLPAVALRALSDERLAERVAGGHAEPFTVLYDRHHQALYRYALSLLRHPQDAQDALQNAMIKALKALSAGTVVSNLRAWLFQITHNEAMSLTRRARPTVELGEAVHVTTGGDEHADEVRQLLADVRELPEQQRAALLLREIRGLDYDEISTVLATSPGNARQSVFKARAALVELERGREMGCGEVQAAISDGDGRRLRNRAMRTHLGGCDACTVFRASIERRQGQLALLPGIPAASAAAVLHGVLGGGGGGAAGGTLAAGGAAGASTASGVGSATGLGGLAVGGAGATLAKGAAVVALAVGGTGAGVAAVQHTSDVRSATPATGGLGTPERPDAPAAAKRDARTRDDEASAGRRTSDAAARTPGRPQKRGNGDRAPGSSDGPVPAVGDPRSGGERATSRIPSVPPADDPRKTTQTTPTASPPREGSAPSVPETPPKPTRPRPPVSTDGGATSSPGEGPSGLPTPDVTIPVPPANTETAPVPVPMDDVVPTGPVDTVTVPEVPGGGPRSAAEVAPTP